MAKILDGKVVAETLRQQLLQKINTANKKLKLAIIHSNDPASQSYLKGRKKIMAFMDVELVEIVIDSSTSKEDLIHIIMTLNNDVSVDGIMIDRPLPKCFDENKILSMIDTSKDVDGYTYANLGKLVCNQNAFLACTPAAAIAILDYYKIPLEGKNVMVIGRSINVGKPLALMLLNRNATVSIAHSKTQNLAKQAKKADIIFSCVGKANFITKDFVSKKTILVDIGINFDENNQLCGDVAKECYEYVKAYTPVPGGVGVMTNIMLMENLYLAYQKREQHE